MMQVKNIIHAIRQPPWVILLPIILIIQLLLIFAFYGLTFIGILLGAFFWLTGWLLLIILGFCLIFHNKWAILAIVFLLFVPIPPLVITFYFPDRTTSKISYTASTILFLYLPLLVFFVANIMLFLIAQKRKVDNYNITATIALFIFLTVALMFPSYYIGTCPGRLEIRNNKKQAQVVIGKVEAYYQTHQHYPESLTELGYEKDDLLLTGMKSPLHYVKYRDRCYLEFADPLDFLGYWHYDLKNHKWTYE